MTIFHVLPHPELTVYIRYRSDSMGFPSDLLTYVSRSTVTGALKGALGVNFSNQLRLTFKIRLAHRRIVCMKVQSPNAAEVF